MTSSSVGPTGKELSARAEADVIVAMSRMSRACAVCDCINPDLDFDFARLPRANLVDRRTLQALEELKVPPSPPAGDPGFLRRVSLDLTGEQPHPRADSQFLADKGPDKRQSCVDTLLARPEHVSSGWIKLGDLLQISQARQGNGAYRYQEWVDRCLSENTPWDVMVTKMLTALGDPNDPETGGPVNYALDCSRGQRSGRADGPAVPGPEGCAVPSATIILSTSGPRTITSDWRPSSPRFSGGMGMGAMMGRPRSRSTPRARSCTCGPSSRRSRGCREARS